MAYSILYSEFDHNSLFLYMDAFAKALGMSALTIDSYKCMGLLARMKMEFPHNDGMTAASPFKKVANFVTLFVAEAPISDKFPAKKIGRLYEVRNHQNAMIAYELAVDGLHEAKIKRSSGEEIVLNNRIAVSEHSYVDIIEALSSVRPSDHFRLVSVLFEQLAYRVNPDASYNMSV